MLNPLFKFRSTATTSGGVCTVSHSHFHRREHHDHGLLNTQPHTYTHSQENAHTHTRMFMMAMTTGRGLIETLTRRCTPALFTFLCMTMLTHATFFRITSPCLSPSIVSYDIVKMAEEVALHLFDWVRMIS